MSSRSWVAKVRWFWSVAESLDLELCLELSGRGSSYEDGLVLGLTVEAIWLE